MSRYGLLLAAALAATIAGRSDAQVAVGQSASSSSSSGSTGAAPFGGGESGKPGKSMPTAKIPAAVAPRCFPPWYYPYPIVTPPVFVGPYYGYYPYPYAFAPTYPPPPITLTPTHPSSFVIPGFAPPISPPLAEIAMNAGTVPANGGPDRAARTARRMAERFEEDLKVGDRLFRAGELARAERRYKDAAEQAPTRADPHIRMAQVSLARRDFAQAARHIDDAQTAEPGWQLRARPRDIQNLFGNPADFARVLSDLESHLQAHPEDRDAWLVLGTELYLTGRTDRANDAFLRLTDRKPNPTLAGFLDMMPAAP